MQHRMRGKVYLTLTMTITAVAAAIPPTERTADMPDSWLVLYNRNDSYSRVWKDWYIEIWGIPSENVLGLSIDPQAEKIHISQFESQVFNPVRDYLSNNPSLEAKIMGILVGFHVPGNFYWDSNTPAYQGGGGWSVSNNLQDLQYFNWFQRTNPHKFVAYWQPEDTPLTKADLGSRCYMSARIDGPSVSEVAMLTIRAREITENNNPLSPSSRLYYDYLHPGAPGGDEWAAMKTTTETPLLTTPVAEWPWLEFESLSETTPDCAMRFSFYRINNWDTVNWGGQPAGPRILGYALNSYGATTVRSTTDLGGRYVPNALFNGGFAAAIGATAEPLLGTEPQPDTIAWGLSRGWILGESVFRANPYRNHMWELLGDPLLRIPQWFTNVCPAPPTNLGPCACTDGSETTNASPELTFSQTDPNAGQLLSYTVEIDNDSDFSSPLIRYVSAPCCQGPAQFVVGQAAQDGTYETGEEGQALPPDTYYWRAKSTDDEDQDSEWTVANPAYAAFVVVEPLTLTHAVTRKTHGSVGEFDIDIPLDAIDGGVETRFGGPTHVILRFNRAIAAADGQLDETEIEVTGATCLGVESDFESLSVYLDDTLDLSCIEIRPVGITDLSGNPLSNDWSVRIRAVLGDGNQDGRVNFLDMAVTKTWQSSPLSSENAHMDFNINGTINLIDAAISKSSDGQAAVCP